MYKIMIIDDSEEIRNELSILLKKNNFEPSAPDDFNNITDFIKNDQPHLVLLDINLPNYDGFKLCTEIRNFSSVPIIFVTSRNTDMDEFLSITLGGDDFIIKPYNSSILIARITSLLKRAYPNKLADDLVEYNNVKIDILAGKVHHNNKSVELTKNELKILHYLFINKEKIVTRTDLIEYLWDNKMFVDDNTLSVNITRIRNKLESIGITGFIKTRRGQGYMI